jgi:hypothetical protein
MGRRGLLLAVVWGLVLRTLRRGCCTMAPQVPPWLPHPHPHPHPMTLRFCSQNLPGRLPALSGPAAVCLWVKGTVSPAWRHQGKNRGQAAPMSHTTTTQVLSYPA